MSIMVLQKQTNMEFLLEHPIKIRYGLKTFQGKWMGFFYMVLEQVYFAPQIPILLFPVMPMKRVGLGKKQPFI